MRIERSDMVWLDEEHELSLSELAQFSGLPERDLQALVDCGAIAPVDPGAATVAFSAHWVVVARTATRLRNDFELDTQGLAVALTLLDRIRELEARLRDLDAQRPRSHR